MLEPAKHYTLENIGKLPDDLRRLSGENMRSFLKVCCEPRYNCWDDVESVSIVIFRVVPKSADNGRPTREESVAWL